MAMRRQLVLVLAGIFASLGASYRTANFVVEAGNAQVAERVGQWAEYYRKEKAIQWLGREMPPWSEPCPLRVTVTASGAGGATSFSFNGGQPWQTMHIEGPLDRLIASVLPHEVTHTVFAHYFRQPVPRWADEGGAVLSEDDLERGRHDAMTRQMLNSGHYIPLNRLFALRDYPENPRDIGALYAQGFSVSNFLVASSNRQTFLAFVAHGMQYGWDNAAQTHYKYQSVNQLEQAWLDYLIKTKKQPGADVARTNRTAPGVATSRVIVRLTAPPAEPLQESLMPLVRAQAPEAGQGNSWSDAPRQSGATRQGYLPEYNPGAQGPAAQQQWQAPTVRLGRPQFDSPAVAPAQGDRTPISPAGYPQ